MTNRGCIFFEYNYRSPWPVFGRSRVFYCTLTLEWSGLRIKSPCGQVVRCYMKISELVICGLKLLHFDLKCLLSGDQKGYYERF